MHRAGPGSDRPPSPRRRRHRPDSGPASALLQPPPDPGPADLTPRRTRVTIREIPQPVPLARRVSRRDMILHICAAVLAIAVLVAIFAQ